VVKTKAGANMMATRLSEEVFVGGSEAFRTYLTIGMAFTFLVTPSRSIKILLIISGTQILFTTLKINQALALSTAKKN